MPGRPNLAVIPSLACTSFSGAVFRVVPEALRQKILSTEGNRCHPGRYHTSGETGILYTSLNEEVAIRELDRHASRDNLKGGLVAGRINVRLQKVLDMTSEANLRKLGLCREDLISPNHTLTQAIGLQARKAGFQGVRIPSATGSGENLLIFENNLGEGCLIEVKKIKSL